MKQDINWLLEQWGIWARQDGTGKLINTASQFFAHMVAPSDDDILMIGEEAAMQIDSALSALADFNKEAREVLIMRHYYNMPKRTIAKRLDCGRPKVQAIVESGEAFIAGRIGTSTMP